MKSKVIDLLLADDDKDDCLLFEEALEEIPLKTALRTVHNGEQLLNSLNLLTAATLPAILFLDLNMPRKNGFECLTEIKSNDNLRDLPVVIYSTTNEPEIINLLFDKGAHFYIRKPTNFSKLKEMVHLAISSIISTGNKRPAKENFILYS
jgi:CheY-like chemotaxis protein